MAEIPADLLPRLKMWWSTLEGGTQAIFEAIYLDAPGAVSNALSGGAWVADNAEPGLAAQLGGEEFESDHIPSLHAPEPADIPIHAMPGQNVTIRWKEANRSKADLGAYVTDVYVQTDGGETLQGGQVRLDGAGVAAGATVDREWMFQAAGVGTLYVTIYMNAEGTDHGSGIPGPQGFRGVTSGQLTVGATEGQAADQDMAAWNSALSNFGRAGGAYGAFAGDTDAQNERALAAALPELQEGFNWLAVADNLTDEEKKQIGGLGDFFGGVDADRAANAPAERLEELRTAFATLTGLSQPGGWESVAGRSRLTNALNELRQLLGGPGFG